MASSSSSSLPERLTALLPNPVPRSGVAADTASPQAPGANGAPRSLHAPPGSTAAAAVAAPPRVVPPTLPLSSSSSSSVAAQPSSSGSSGGASTASALWTTAAAASAAAASAAGATGAASVFDVLVVSKFAASLRPTFDHVLQSIILPAVPALAPLAWMKDELWLALYGQLQLYYLGSSAATMEEALYGWRRAGKGGRASTLSPRALVWSYVGAVLAPYLLAKFQAAAASAAAEDAAAAADATRRAAYRAAAGAAAAAPPPPPPADSDSDGDEDAEEDRSWVAAVMRALLRATPAAAACGSLLQLGFLLAYGARVTPYPTVWHALARLRLRQATAEDDVAAKARADAAAAWVASSDAPAARIQRGVAGFATASRVAVVVLLVVLKAVDWYTAPPPQPAAAAAAAGGAADAGSVRLPSMAASADVPPPPPPTSPIAGSPSLTCPLCHGPHTAPTATPAGVVYCHACILGALREAAANGQPPTCPTTGTPCPPAALRRLFDDATPATAAT